MANLQSPVTITAIKNTTNNLILVLDKNSTHSSIWRFMFSGSTGSAGTRLIQTTENLVGLFLFSITSFATASLNGQTIQRYNTINGAATGTFGPSFTSITSVSVDFYGRVYVYDSPCSCLRVFSSSGSSTSNITLDAEPLSVAHTREAHFVVHPFGVTAYYDELKISVRGTNSTCASKGSSAAVTVVGGANPYTFGSIPFLVRSTTTSSTYTFTKITPPVTNYSVIYTIYDDAVGRAITEANAPAYKRNKAGPPLVTPRTGQFAYCFYMVANTKFRLNPIDNFDPTLFSRLEMWVNPLGGGQTFQFDFGGNLRYNYNPGDFPLNTWTKLTIDFTKGTAIRYTQWSLNDLSNAVYNTSAVNPVCFDDIYAFPYSDSPAPFRKFYASDFCGNTVTSDNILLTDDNVLKLDVASKPTTCNSNGNDGAKGYDGVITANATGGSGTGYTYSWTFSNTTMANVSNLPLFNTNMLIYDNGMAPGFVEVGSAASKNSQDTTHYRSAPYSYSFTPTLGSDSLIFNFPSIFNNDDYSALEFWIYTGENGAQAINMYMLRSGTVQLGPSYSLARLAGVSILPPATWYKLSFPTILSGGTFAGIMFYVSPQTDGIQSTIYFDDIMLISTKYVVTSTDSSGCSVANSYINVTSPDLVSSVVSTNNVKCFGGSDGGVSFNVNGGTAPYFYSWSDSSIPNINSSSYSFPPSGVTTNITDINGCTSPTVFTYIAQPTPMTLTFEVTPISCNGAESSITVSALGGLSPYNYIWSSSAETLKVVPQGAPLSVYSEEYDNSFQETSELSFYSSICAGGVNAPISDDPNFTASHEGYCSIVIPSGYIEALLQAGCPNCIDTSQYSGIELFIALENPSDLDYMTIALATGSFVVTTPIVLGTNSTNLTAFAWQKVVYDFSEFSIGYVDSILIRSSVNTTGLILIDDMVLMPRPTANTRVTGTNVYTGYQSTISGGATSYSVTVTDANGCQIVQNFTIDQPPAMIVTETVSNGDVSLDVSGGVAPYTYLWDTDETTSSVQGLSAGAHDVAVFDSYGCVVNKTIVVNSSDSRASLTGILAGSITGAAVAIFAVAGFIYWHIHRKQRENVKAILLTEAGERRTYKIDYSEITIGNLIGAGSFGQVFAGEYKGTDIAVKKLKNQHMTKQQLSDFSKEAKVMAGLRNPNIVLFMGVCVDPGKLCIVSELMERGDLSEVLRNKDNMITPQMIFHMARDTLKGLQFIHSSGFVHCNLKSPNLLVDRSWNIKITDFGLSSARDTSTDASLLWTAPEILTRASSHNFASDIYSFGIILWELMSRQLPWQNVAPAAVLTKVTTGGRPAIPANWDAHVVTLMEACWNANPSSRPTVKVARQMLEENIIKTVGEFELGSDGSSSIGGSNDFKDTGYAIVSAPQPPLVLVVARVADAVQVWKRDPRGMAKALESLNAIMETFAAKMGGYEVLVQSTIIYAFAKPVHAVNFCVRVQQALLEHSWPPSILGLNITAEERKDGILLHRGLRVCMGAHLCGPSVKKDVHTGKTTYAGPSMKNSEQLSLHGCPGSVMVDQEIYNAIMAQSSEVEPFSISPIGAVKCGSTELNLFKIVPLSNKMLLEEVVVTPSPDEDIEPWFVDFNDIKLGEVIGAGSFGDVFAANYRNKKVAVKILSRHKITKQVYLELQTECAVLSALKHKNVLDFKGMCLEMPNVCIVSEIAERSSLGQVLAAKGELPWELRLSFALDIARGLAFIHKNGIIHRDLKSSNLLVSSDWTVKVADFGFNRIKAVNQTLTQNGTVSWTAPELFQDSEVTEKIDVYSYAIVLWEIISRAKPWTGKHSMKIINAVVLGERPPINNIPADTPPVLKSLMISCWDPKPENRPSFVEIISRLDENNNVSVTLL